jgi:truncated hemoglobin YjbI
MEAAISESFYTRIGGEPAVTEAVGRLYRVVLADERLAPYFEGVDLRLLHEHMIALLSQVLGGPDNYSGRELRNAHAGLGITPDHYSLVGAYLIGVLAGLGIDDEVLSAVRGVLAASAEAVVA